MRADEFLDQGNIDGRRVWHPSGSRRPGRHDLVVNDAGLEVGATVSPPWSAAAGVATGGAADMSTGTPPSENFGVEHHRVKLSGLTRLPIVFIADRYDRSRSVTIDRGRP